MACGTRFRGLGPDGQPEGGEVPRGPKPPWLKVRLPGGGGYMRMRSVLSRERLNTICLSGRCPNAGECFSRGTATFLLMGGRCTRQCAFCEVRPGAPEPLDATEPERIARTVADLGLSYVVVTSVTRDDLPDGGAGHFAAVVRAIKRHAGSTPGSEEVRVEILIPDLRGDPAALATVTGSDPDVLGHNVETCRRLYPLVRPQGDYDRALDLLSRARRGEGPHLVKSGFMVGLGETDDEVDEILRDLAAAGCQVVTIGQYLRPSPHHLPVRRYVTPERFVQIESRAGEFGFVLVVAGPLVRSSYLADRAFARARLGSSDS